MLEKLKINNVALIESLEIDFQNGFNVILGETGAGKSIIIDALNFVLGSKADKTLIRAGEETMKVVAVFSSQSKKVFELIEGFGIEAGDEILLSRLFTQSGKSEARINGEIVSVSMLKQVGEALVDAYSQNESIMLLKQKNHLEILDLYKPEDLVDIKNEIETLIEQLNDITKKIKQIGGNEANRERQIDMLSYQINEIENANLVENEDEILEEKLKKLSNSEKILEAVSSANSCLFNDNAGLDLFRHALSSLRSVERYDSNIADLCSKFEENLINFEEVCESVFSLSNEYNFDENTLNQMIDRRDLLDSLKRKYGGNLTEVSLFLEKAKEELELLQNSKEILISLENEKKNLLQKAKQKFDFLEQIRKEHAHEIEEKVVNGLYELGITKAKFCVNFFNIANSLEEVETYSINCLNDVEFLFSANYGEELKPLSKTISGGEMNRFMLVFKNIIADINGPSTLIFDEIDAGISGKTASQVAQKMAVLSKNYQILCISHLPQVASMGDCFFYVSKAVSNERTTTSIKLLKEDEIINQIALLTYGSVDEKKFELTHETIEQNSKLKMNL